MARRRGIFERFAQSATRWTGTTWAFFLAVGAIAVWGVSGPLFGFSDTWQLVINTATTIITFLMVFLIQQTQNKDADAIHLKLNELVASQVGASNRLVNVEDLSEEDIRRLHKYYNKLVELAKADDDELQSHSIEEAQGRHLRKARPQPGNGRPNNNPGGSNGAAGVADRPAKSIDEVVAQFLEAAHKVQERLRWHEEQAAALKDALARHGVRKAALASSESHATEPTPSRPSHCN